MQPALGITRPRRAGKRAIHYNGVDQYGTAHWIAGRINPFETGGAFTFLVRMKSTAGGYGLAGFMSATSNYEPVARIYVDPAGAATWYSRSTAVTYKVVGPTVNDGAEHGLGLVEDNGHVAWYLDGVAGATTTYTRTNQPGSDQFCVAATVGLSPIQHMAGDVSEVAVLDVALSAGEVARWSDGTLDLHAYGEHLVAWFWPGDPPADASFAPNMAGQRDGLAETNTPTVVAL